MGECKLNAYSQGFPHRFRQGGQSKPGGGNKATSEGIFLVRREIV